MARMNSRDVAIIGAGPAGCTAAMILARAGWSVQIIEQHRFPRDKVCGECISALGIDIARRIGVADSLLRLGAVQLRASKLIAPNGEAATIELPRPMWGLSRCAMDACLLEAARESGARLLQPARCEKIVPGRSPGLIVRDLASNAIQSLAASRLLICDGKGLTSSSAELGIKAHFVHVDGEAGAISLFGVAGHYVGVAPIEQNRWNVAMSVPAARVAQFRGDLDAMFDRLKLENVALARVFRNARRAGSWLASPLPRFAVESQWMDGTIPLGNAAAALDPIGGEGIGLAMQSAEIAARELIAASRENRAAGIEHLREEFKKLWRIRSAACRAAALAVSNPTFARIAAPIVDQTPALQRLALELTGKLP